MVESQFNKFKEDNIRVMLEAGQILDEEQLAFLANSGISEAPVAHHIIPQNLAFQIDDLDAYDLDCDDLSSLKAVLMANLSSCDPEVLFETQDAVIHDTNPFAPNDLLVLSLFKQMTDHVAHLDKKNQTNKMVNESLTVELERYKERITIFEQRLNVDLNQRKDSVENVKKDIDEIETINIELEYSVPKLLLEYEILRKERKHLKSIYRDRFDSIIKTHVQSNEHYDSLIAQINAKSLENLDLNAQLQEKVFAITTLKNKLRKIKGKTVVNTVVLKPNDTLALGMFNLDIEPISDRLKNNKDAHEVYIRKTIEYADTLCGFVEQARTQYPSEPLLESACMFTKHVQELLVYASQTCPNSPKPNEKLVVVTPINKDKRVRFAKPITSSNNSPMQTDCNAPLRKEDVMS
nr:hypothetical protein [Tanacetum cinerariifolium]